MAINTITGADASLTQPSASPAGGISNVGALLAAAGNGIRITGLVLAVEEPKDFKGQSAKGNSYAFAVREMQIFTGNKAVVCKHQLEIGVPFPPVNIGEVRTFKVRGVRMNGTVPQFELETTE